MAKRVKSDKPVLLPVPHWNHANEFVRRIGDLTLQIAAAEYKAKDDINEAKAELAKTVKPLQEKIKLYAQSLEAFAVINKNDFSGKRSKKLYFGTLGWRKSTAVNITKKTLELIKQVFSKKAAAYIHFKESVDKDALAKLTDEQLASIGARRKEKDVFFVEPDLPEAVDYCE